MVQRLRACESLSTRCGSGFLFCWVALGKLENLSEPREDNKSTVTLAAPGTGLNPAVRAQYVPGDATIITTSFFGVVNKYTEKWY